MLSWSIIIYLSLLFASSSIDARYRAHPKRRYSVPISSFTSNIPSNNQPMNIEEPSGVNDDQALLDLLKETSKFRTSTQTPTNGKHQASEQQVEQFTRLLFERLNLREPPNVTVNVNEGIGFPSSIVKQLEQQTREQQYQHHKEEDFYHRQQKIHDEIMPTAERAILPGDHIQHHTCERQLAAKLNLNKAQIENIDCFRFTKSPKESNSLPNNQFVNELRIYMKKTYFHWIDRHEQLTPDMFKIYQVFRPTSNETTHIPPYSLTDTMRLSVSKVKELSDSWLELIIDGNNKDIDLQQLYRQLIMPWYGVAIDRDLSHSTSSSSSYSSSSMERSLTPSTRHYHRLYHSKKRLSSSSNSDNEDGMEPESREEHQLPYMLVEYGGKISSSSSGNRGTRSTVARPARGCNSNSPCCRRSLTIDLDQGNNALNFVIYPRQLDIGECIGLCGTSGSSLKHVDVKNAQFNNEQHSAYNMLLLQNNLHLNRSTTTTQVNQPEQPSSQCCSYSRTGGLELMYTTTNGGPIIRKFIPNMVVEECKCGLPATIQQV